METRKIFSKFFQAGGCELRIGVYESFDTLCIYLESDQSGGADPDRNFWVRYRMAVVNQKHAERTVWKESSICTKTWNNSVLQFMKVSDMMEPDSGFLVRDTIIFSCEIVDCCPWFEFSDLEVMVSDEEQDAISTDPDELLDSDDSDGVSNDEEDIFRSLLASAGFHLSYGDNPALLLDPSQLQVTLREKLLLDAGAIAAFLTGLRVYLDDPVKVKRLLLPTRLPTSVNSVSKKVNSKGEATSPSLMNLLMGVKVLQQAIADLLLDIMVEYCQPPESEGFTESTTRPQSDASQSNAEKSFVRRAFEGTVSVADSQSPALHRIDDGHDRMVTTQAVPMSNIATADAEMAKDLELTNETLSETSTRDKLIATRDVPVATAMGNSTQKSKWPGQSDELLGLIVNSLKALDGAVPQGCPEPRRRPQSAQKIAVVLERAPNHLQPDLIALVPKLVDASEHAQAVDVLLDRLRQPGAEPALQLPVFGALSQLEVSSNIWETIMDQTLRIFPGSNDEPLAAAISFTFKASAKCHKLALAVKAVRERLKYLGTAVSPPVLDALRSTIRNNLDVAKALLSDIDTDPEGFEHDLSSSSSNAPVEECGNEMSTEQLQLASACWRVADVDMLIEMLMVPCLRAEAQLVFERAIARGAFGGHSMIMVLERRYAQKHIMDSRCHLNGLQTAEASLSGAGNLYSTENDEDFCELLGLAEKLALSRDLRVREFVSTLYAVMFKVYCSERYCEQMLRGLVERATSKVRDLLEVELSLDVLTFLIREEEGTARPVLCMMKEAVELADADRATLFQQLQVSEAATAVARTERQWELNSLIKEKAALSQKLAEAEAAQIRLKSESKTEIDRLLQEKRDLADRLHEMESQLEWVRSEHNEEVTRLATEKKNFQARLRDAETHILQLKSRRRDELKRAVKEKNALAERLKSAEGARRQFDEEQKRFATETITREEIRQSLEDEVRRLTQTVGQTEGGLREKEEQVMRCEAYIDGMEAKLHACQTYIQTLETSLQDEMTRHGPLYGFGLENLTLTELETLSRIHEEGLRKLRILQQQRKGNEVMVTSHLDSLVNLSTLSPPIGTVAMGLPPTAGTTGVPLHGNGHLNGTMGPWFNSN
ncbi:hypothetical protein KP509_07G070900 [Ceratopteris richardii]|nr:hypothetical protein KP509_07G070900 [Ceratopteris richardii]